MFSKYHIFLLSFILCISACSRPDTASIDQPGVVSAATPEAARAGAEILEAGGNAADAAVAVGFTLAVTEPGMSGLGGQSQIILQAPGLKPLIVNGTSFAPGNLPKNLKREDVEGHRLTTVPTTVKALHFLWKKHGSGNITWEQLLASAIRYAGNGYKIGPFQHRVFLRHADALRENPVTRDLFLTSEGQVPSEGSYLIQDKLAHTLQRLAENGADDFYTGALAREIVADIQSNGGWITIDDMRRLPEPEVLSPLKSTYRDWDVYTLPPPGGGWVVLQMLNLLEQTPKDTLVSDPVTRILTVAEAIRIGHRSRRLDPVKDLSRYMPDVAEKISKASAQRLWNDATGETTHYSVVDASGMAVGVTASINAYFGANAAHSTLGFLYNSYMTEFEFGKPDHPFAMRPNAMPYSSMSPTILSKDNMPHMVLGSPGSARIMSAVSQVIHNWVDNNMSIADAVTAHRLHVVADSRIYMESPEIPDEMKQAIESQLFMITTPRMDLANDNGNPYFGGVHAIAWENGVWTGAADPRRDGVVQYTGDYPVEACPVRRLS